MRDRRPPLRVFIIEDDPDQLDMTRRLLRAEGFEVEATPSSIGASNLVRTFGPDVVLVDVNLPALSGHRLIEIARRAAPPHTRFVLFSACDEGELRRLAREANADAYITKGLDPQELARRLRAMCGSRAAAVE